MSKVLLLSLALSANIAIAQNSEHKSYSQKINGTNLSFTMEAIPGGEYKRGSQTPTNDDEKPVHHVKIDPFWMGTYEVT